MTLARRIESVPEARFVGGTLAVALLLRLAFLAFAASRLGLGLLAWDEISVAQNLLAGRGYSFDWYAMFGPARIVTAFFPPAYVLNVWLLLATFHSLLAVAIENALLSWGVAWGVHALARRVCDPLGARVALLMAAVYPPFVTRITHGNGLYFKMLLVLLLVIALVDLWRAPRTRTALRAGLWAGLLGLSMPDALLYALLFAAAAFAVPRRRAAGAALVVLATTAAILAPWAVRNAIVFHRFCATSTNGGFNLYMGQNPATTGEMDFDVVTDLDRRLGGALARAGEVDRDRILVRESVAFVRREPGLAARRMLERAVTHWGFRATNTAAMGLGRAAEPGEFSRAYVLYLWSYAAAYALLLVAALPGLWRSRARWGDLAPVLLVFAYSTIVAALFVVQTKMRLTKAEPAMIPFAATTVAALLRGRTGRPAAARR